MRRLGWLLVLVGAGCGSKTPPSLDHAVLIARNAQFELIELPRTYFREFLVRASSGDFEVTISTSDTPVLEEIDLDGAPATIVHGDFASGRFAVVELGRGPLDTFVRRIERDIGDSPAYITWATKQTGEHHGLEATTFPVEKLTKATAEIRAAWHPALRAALNERIDQAAIGVYRIPRTEERVLVVGQVPLLSLSITEAQRLLESVTSLARPDPVALP